VDDKLVVVSVDAAEPTDIVVGCACCNDVACQKKSKKEAPAQKKTHASNKNSTI
jgi:hypothetical protein